MRRCPLTTEQPDDTAARGGDGPHLLLCGELLRQRLQPLAVRLQLHDADLLAALPLLLVGLLFLLRLVVCLRQRQET